LAEFLSNPRIYSGEILSEGDYLMADRSPEWPSTHKTLIGQLQERPNGPAWDRFAEVYMPLIYRYCRRRSVQDVQAEDATSKTYIAVRKGINNLEFDPKRGKFRSWLGTIAVRELMRVQKDDGALPPRDDVVALALRPNDEAGWIADFNAHIYETAKENIRPRFDPQTWEAFVLLFEQDRPPVDVAAQFGKPRAWADRVRFRVLKRLKEEVLYLTADMPAFHRDVRG
jgi:RNA polymerase sigma factor (sigma-70 family)